MLRFIFMLYVFGEKQVVVLFVGEVIKEGENIIKLVVLEGLLKEIIIYIINIEVKNIIEEEELRFVRMKNIYKFMVLVRFVLIY